MDAVPFGGGLPMAPLPPLPVWGFGISRGRLLKETLHQACAQTKGGTGFILAARARSLTLRRYRKPAVWEVMATE